MLPPALYHLPADNGYLFNMRGNCSEHVIRTSPLVEVNLRRKILRPVARQVISRAALFTPVELARSFHRSPKSLIRRSVATMSAFSFTERTSQRQRPTPVDRRVAGGNQSADRARSRTPLSLMRAPGRNGQSRKAAASLHIAGDFLGQGARPPVPMTSKASLAVNQFIKR